MDRKARQRMIATLEEQIEKDERALAGTDRIVRHIDEALERSHRVRREFLAAFPWIHDRRSHE